MEFNIYVFAIALEILILSCVSDACDMSNCRASNGVVCNEQGTCDCGVCHCVGSYSGPTCEECPTCPSPCEVFKDCVACKIFGTGPMSIMDCLLQCEDIAAYMPVDKSEFDSPDPAENRTLCETVNKDWNDNYCLESFRIGGMSNGYRNLYVRTEQHCSEIYRPTDPPIVEVTEFYEYNDVDNDTTVYTNDNDAADDEDDSIEVVAVSGSRHGDIDDGNGANAWKVSVYTTLIAVTSVMLS